MKVTIFLAIIVLLFLMASQAKADDSLGCNAVLVKTEVLKAQSEYLQIAVLSLINRSSYETAKHNVDATAIFAPDLFSGSYDDFEERLASYKSQLNFNLTDATSQVYLTSYLPAEVTTAWLRCKELAAASTYGFHVLLEKVTDDKVTVFYIWSVAPANAGEKARLDSFQISGIKKPYPSLPPFWRSGEKMYVSYKRISADVPFDLNAAVGGDGQHVDFSPSSVDPSHFNSMNFSCGQLLSNAVAAAVETGQAAGRSNPDVSRDLPITSTKVDTNSNRAGAAVVYSATCDSTPSDSLSYSKTIVLTSLAMASGPSDGASWYAWARWAPTWSSTVTVPYSKDPKPFTLTLRYREANSSGSALPPCTFTVDGKPNSITPNSQGDFTFKLEASTQTHPAVYQLKLTCDRPEVLMFNETISLTFVVERPNNQAPAMRTNFVAGPKLPTSKSP
jgi:hypothetical protein